MLKPYQEFLVRLYCLKRKIPGKMLDKKRTMLIYNSRGFQIFKLRYSIEVFIKKLVEKLKL